MSVDVTGAEVLILREMAAWDKLRRAKSIQSVARGTVYGTLPRMVEKGLVEKGRSADDIPVPVYSVSPKGRDHLLSIDKPGSLEEQLNEWSARLDLALARRDEAVVEIGRCGAEMRQLQDELEKENQE